jgi:subtilisin family serine protease
MRRVLTTMAVGALLAGALLPTGQAQAQPKKARAATNAPRPLPAGRHWTVTLVTGDVVQVSTDANGRQRASVDAGRGPVRIATQPDGHVFVLPATVASLVGRMLDPALFDVTELIKEGDDDAHDKSVPLIVRGPGNAPLTTGMQEHQTLHALGAVAATMPKTRPIGAALRAMAAHHGTMTPQVTGGVRYVWLDRKVHATALTQAKPALDANLTQIHAPQAWQAGVTGKGVTVAVLDTGIDATHPDLRGKVVASQDFSGSGDTVDRFGHGTHVAATIAGTGAASGGARKGVAYGARLLIGKVLGDDGTGDESWIIAGMEWAAPKAKIISMSLGSDGPDDGTDPMSAEVDLLSKQDHTLFVVAAGNSGPGDATVDSPGSASTALTVGAVDGKNRLADFSSRGPLLGSQAIKPEVDAPGVDIVEARAAGTTMGTPINARYTMASGTSMATPHVAGVAALVAQQHPDWTGDQLKAAIVDAAQPVTGGDAYEHGAGVVDAKAALTPLTGEQAVLNLGTFAYPQPKGVRTKTVAWRNTGAKPTTLKLTATAGPRTGTATKATISPGQVTVPAHGTGSATLTLDPHSYAAKPGLYAGTVTATGAGGTVRTPFGFYEEPESHNLTIKVTPVPGGTDIDSAVFVNDLDDVALFSQEIDVNGTETVRVPAGRYSVEGGVADEIAHNFVYAIGGNPDVDLHHDATVTVDAARAKAPTASVSGRPSQVESVYGGFFQSLGHGWGYGDSVWGAYPSAGTAYVQPMSAPKNSGFTAEEGVRLDSPVVIATLADGPVATLLGASSPYVPAGARTVPAFYAGNGASMTGTKGKVAVVDYDPNGEDPATIAQRARDAGATLVTFASTAAGTPVVAPAGRSEAFTIPVLGVGGADGGRLVTAAKAGGELEVTGQPSSAWDDDLHLSLGSTVTGAPYVLTPAAEKKLARVQDHFDAVGVPVSFTRYTPPIPGDYVSGEFTGERPQPPVQTDHLTPGVAYQDVADVPTGGYSFGYSESPQTYASGSVHSVTWDRRPFFPGPYGGGQTGSGCQPVPVTRTSGNLRVDLAMFRDATDRFDCLAGIIPVRSSLSLTRNGAAAGTVNGAPFGDFAIAPGAATYRLSYDQVTTDPVATDTSTTWTFRSTGPAAPTVEQVPLLEVGYTLPLGSNNRPAGDQATFTVNRVQGVPAAAVKSLAVRTSVDGGKTWTTAVVHNLGGGRFTVTLPKAAGQWVSLKSDAQDTGGSRIQQTLINAYQG